MPTPWFYKIILFASCLLTIGVAKGQEVIAYRSLEFKQVKVLDLPAAELHAFAATWLEGEKPSKLLYRHTLPNKQFTPWQKWSLSNEGNENAARLLTISGSTRRIEIKSDVSTPISLRSTSYVVDNAARTTYTALSASACPCPAPALVTRESWCPAGDCDPVGAPSPVTPEHLVVHHSATDPGTDNFSLVVRAIYDFHVNTNGWDDIGYNLLIAPDGMIYEGRGTSTQGAHFCGANSGTLGVCLLGNFEETQVQAAALSTLSNLGAYISCEFDITPDETLFHAPSGKTLHGIAGHQDGCNTSCPGENLYSLLPTVRDAVTGRIQAGCTSIAAPENLTASALTDGDVRLNWDTYSNASLFILERSTAGPSSFEFLAEVTGDANSFIDNQTVSGATYYRVRALVDGSLSPYSNVVSLNVSSSESAPVYKKPRLARNPVKGLIEISNLSAPVDQAFISDASGRTLLELPGSSPKWQIRNSNLPKGRYWIMLFSGNEWYTIPFEYHP